MLFKLLPVAVLAIVCGAFSASAQSVHDIPAPRETPPSSFRGAQYVDSRGCVFVRAGIDGKVSWVPRVDASRKVLCGYPPTLTAMAAAPEAETVLPSVQENVVAEATVSEVAKPAAKAKPVVAAAVVPTVRTTSQDYVDTPRATGVPGQLACPARAPFARRFPLQGGGTVVLCLSRENLLTESAAVSNLDGADLINARAPAGARTELVCPRSAPVAQRLPQVGGGATVLCTTGDGRTANLAVPVRRSVAEPALIEVSVPQATAAALPALVAPREYKLAWKDDRLNPRRGLGTAAGQLAQDQIWTREVPARLVTEVAAEGRSAAQVPNTAAGNPIRISTKSSSHDALGGKLIQVGSFAQRKNAELATARIKAMGMPVALGHLTRGGKTYQVVFAGPFAAENKARSALAKVRRGGFPDAIIN